MFAFNSCNSCTLNQFSTVDKQRNVSDWIRLNAKDFLKKTSTRLTCRILFIRSVWPQVSSVHSSSCVHSWTLGQTWFIWQPNSWVDMLILLQRIFSLAQMPTFLRQAATICWMFSVFEIRFDTLFFFPVFTQPFRWASAVTRHQSDYTLGLICMFRWFPISTARCSAAQFVRSIANKCWPINCTNQRNRWNKQNHFDKRQRATNATRNQRNKRNPLRHSHTHSTLWALVTEIESNQLSFLSRLTQTQHKSYNWHWHQFGRFRFAFRTKLYSIANCHRHRIKKHLFLSEQLLFFVCWQQNMLYYVEFVLVAGDLCGWCFFCCCYVSFLIQSFLSRFIRSRLSNVRRSS